MMRSTPTYRRARILPLFAFALLACIPAPAHALRIVTWNLLAYPDANLAGRQPSFRTVMANINADVLFAQELHSQAGVDSFQTNVLNVVEPGQWANSGFFQLQTSPSIEGGAIFYKPAKVAISFTSTLVTGGPRNVLFTRVTPVGYTALPATFRIYSVHFKAGGPATSDSTTRRLEATSLRNSLNNVPAGTNFLLGGDTNIYGAYEGAYIRLTESQTDNDGQCLDVLSMPGNWHTVSGYAAYDTQCPCNNCTAGVGQSGGGLDDRFDLVLGSNSMRNSQGVDLLSSGYGAYGNDGQHFNTDVNGGGFNNAVPINVANALWTASDHLPVVAVVQVASQISAASQIDYGTVITGATAQQTLNVTNSAIAPADPLDYSFSAPAGFSAPVGAQSAAAGVTNPHTITMGTGSTGNKAGALTISTDAPDSPTKSVLLSGRVLAHAEASLDSLTSVVEDSLDFGDHEVGSFTDLATRLHDLGYDALQARLSIDAAEITGTGASRFSIVGGFSPALVGATGKTWNVHFDDSGNPPTDTPFVADLVFHSSDEPLPGATSQPDLVLHLRASVSGNTDVLPGPLPTVLAFAAPRPNPVAGSTTFSFDLPKPGRVSLDLFDLNGRRLAHLVDGDQPAGRHQVSWVPRDAEGRRLAAGLYFARFTTGSFTRTLRLAILP